MRIEKRSFVLVVKRSLVTLEKVISAPLQTNKSLLIHLLKRLSELSCNYSAFILPYDEVTSWRLSRVNIASLICNAGVDGPAPAAVGSAPARGAAPACTAVPAEKKKEEAEKEESEVSYDELGFG
ncbi:large ribosomal subunit protein P1-like [Notamacropus eugenii]|uniref:large ribosomal subunit protein P1-like n=1 Tax=Notamacropus eugenii TaxID=9315 RepID=UPI003B683A82